MSAICLIDTSIFLNILNVPNRNQDKIQVLDDFKEYIELGMTFILPMATVLETGNHIAQNGSGTVRRETAKHFCEMVKGALTGEAPWQLREFPDTQEILSWIDQFPHEAGKNKSSSKTTEGTSFGDLSIIQEYSKCLKKFSMTEIFIWSLDSDLACYHHNPIWDN